MTAKLLILASVLFAYFSYCTAIKCYQCSSHKKSGDTYYGAECNDPFKRDQKVGPVEAGENVVDTTLRECPASISWCMKVAVEAEKGEEGLVSVPKGNMVIRMCGNKPNFKASDNSLTADEYFCNTDGCNGASSMALSALVAGVVAVVAFAVNRL